MERLPPRNKPSRVPVKRYQETLTALNWFLPKLAESLKTYNFQQVNAALRLLSFLSRETGIAVLKDLIIDFSMSNRPETRRQALHTLVRMGILRNLLRHTLEQFQPGQSAGSEPPVSKNEKGAKAASSLKKSPPVVEGFSMDHSGAKTFQAISRIDYLPVMEPVLTFIRNRISHRQIHLDDAVTHVILDPGLCLQILSLANSTYVAPQSSIDDLESAMQLIGMGNLEDILQRTRNIIPFEQLFSSFAGHRFWLHQVGTGQLCLEINDLLTLGKIPHAYLSGLLHDAGKVILAYLFPEQYNAVLTWSREEKIPLTEAEYSCFSMTHEEAGAAFIEKQSLPSQVKSAVRFHRFPEKAISDRELVAIVNMANFLSKKMDVGYSGAPLKESDTELQEQPGWRLLREHFHPRFTEDDFEKEILERATRVQKELAVVTGQLVLSQDGIMAATG